MKNGMVVFLLAAVVISGVNCAYAGSTMNRKGMFFGIDYGNHDVDMKTEFIRRTSGAITEHSFFDDKYRTDAGGLFAGYHFPYRRIYIDGRVFFNLYKDEFQLSSGSSRFINRINHAFGGDVSPGVYLFRGLSLFGKAGIEWGDFDFIKMSPTSTTYDVSTRLVGYTLGLGIAYDISKHFTVKIGYDAAQYDKKEIDASKGTRNDTSLVKPEDSIWYLNLTYRF